MSLVESSITTLDDSILSKIYDYYQLLEQKKIIKEKQTKTMQMELNSIKRMEKTVFRLMKFANVLNFVTNGGIQVKRIPKTHN